MNFLGIEIGGTKLQMVVGDETGKIVERRRFIVDRARGGAGIREQIKPALADLIPASRPAGIGVGFGGPGANASMVKPLKALSIAARNGSPTSDNPPPTTTTSG